MRKTLLSFFTKALTLAAFVLFSQSSFAQIFNFNFENNNNVGTENAVGTPTFTNSGAQNAAYPTSNACSGNRLLSMNNWDNGDYHQFTVNTTGFGNMSLSFCDRADATSIGTFIVRVSSDGGDNWTTVLSSFVPQTTNTASRTTGTFPASANNQPEVLIQIYKTSSPSNARVYFLDNATLSGSPIPTVTGFSPSANCAGYGVTITGTNFTGATSVQINGIDVESYTVNSSTSITATIATNNTTGVITVANANGSGSSANSITINPIPTNVTATPSATSICAGQTINLTASSVSNSSTAHTAFSENFNAAANSWTLGNTSSGGTPSAAAWMLKANGFVYDGNTFNSNDASQFYMTNSDAQGNVGGVQTTTTLTSPAFSTVGMTSATLNFYHHFRNVSSDAGRVYVSTNGASWTQLAIYTNTSGGSVGSANNFSLASISLASYLNQATVYIRFQYTATFDWYWAIDNVSVTGNLAAAPAPTYAWTSVPAGFTSNLQNPTGIAPTVNTVYTVTATNSFGCSANASTVTVVVNPLTVPGSVSGSTTVCASSNSGTLTLAGHTGNVVRWESSLDNFATAPTTIANATTSLNYSNLTATTYYRAVVQSGNCASANSAVATVTVNPASVGGTVAGSTSVCANSNSGTLTLSNYTGTITKWQSSDVSDFSVGVLDIPNTTTTLNYLNLSGTTYYRAVVTNGVCLAAFSSVAAISVDPAVIGGTVSGDTTVCYGNNSGTVNLSGYVGSIIGWESSLDNFATAGTPINNLTAALNYSNLTATTSYRAIISSGTCGNAVSSVATVTVNTTTSWIGTNSSAWNEPANWSCGVVPTSDVDVTITSVMNQPVVGDDAFARSLTLQTGTTLTVLSGYTLTIADAIDGQGNSVLTVENDAHVVQVNDVANTGNAVVNRNSNPLMRLDYILWSSPVSGQNLLSFSPATLANRFYIYNPATDAYNTVAPSTTDFAEGKGYLIRMPDNHPTTATVWNGVFNGTLNNGDVDIAVTNGTYNAIGNPYPSAIDADTFIAQNNLSEALYFWRKTNNALTTSYATYTLAGGVGTVSNNGGDPMLLTPDGIIQPGQGFIAKSTSAALSFDNGMRIGNNGQFLRNAVERNRIWLNLTNANGIFSQTMVSYMTGATNEQDAAIDGLYINDSQLALTSMIGDTEYAIQGRALPFDNADVVPLGFKAITAGTYTIGIDHVDGLFADATQNILLRDNLTDATHDLRTGDYTFATEAGTFNARFEIIYQEALAVANPVWDAGQVVVYKQAQDIVINAGSKTIDNVKVFDIRGRLLVAKDNVNASEVKLYAGSTNQVLIVKITSDDQKEVTKKVMN